MNSTNELGAEIRRAKLRPVSDFRKKADPPLPMTLFLVLFTTGIGCSIPLAVVFHYIPIQQPLISTLVGQIGIAVVVVTVCAGTVWHEVLLPRNDYLVVFQNGFKYRVRLKRSTCLFKDIASFGLGLPSLTPGQKNDFSPGWADMVEKQRENMLYIRFKNGKETKVPGFAARFASEDVQTLEQTVKTSIRSSV